MANISKTYTFDFATTDMTLTVDKSPCGFSSGYFYASPTDGRGNIISNYNFSGYTEIKAKIKITNNPATWWNYAQLAFIDSSGADVAWITSDIASINSTRAFKCSPSTSQAFSSTGVYYLEMVATSSTITFKVYDSGDNLLYTLSGGYVAGKNFSNIYKVKVKLWGSDSAIYVDTLWVNAIETVTDSSKFFQLFN